MAVEYSTAVDKSTGQHKDFLPELTIRQGRPTLPSMGDLGTFVRARRLEMGLTLRQVAERSGLSYQLISQIELGTKPNPTTNTIKALARALEIEPSQLLDPVPA